MRFNSKTSMFQNLHTLVYNNHRFSYIDYTLLICYHIFIRTHNTKLLSTEDTAINILILNLNPDKKDAEFEKYLSEFKEGLSRKLHSVEYVVARDMDIKPCIGCWNCWTKTPGVCVHQDDMHQILKHVNHNDIVIFAVPFAMGFMHSLGKTVQERMIPLLLPYSEIVMGEFHHALRYGTSPELAFLYKPESDTDEEDIQINKDIFERVSLNFRSNVLFFESIKKPATELIHENFDF